MTKSKGGPPNKAMVHLRRTLIAGVFALVPLVATFVILRLLFNFVDGLVSPVMEELIGRRIPGIGFAVTIVLVYLAGLAAANFVGVWVIRRVEDVILVIPGIRNIYHFAKQLVDAFQSSGTAKFRVVIVQWPSQGIHTIAFQTGSIEDDQGRVFRNVLIPTGPTPQSGFLAIFPETEVIPTEMSVEDALKMVVSSGVLSPKDLKLPLKARRRSPGQPSASSAEAKPDVYGLH